MGRPKGTRAAQKTLRLTPRAKFAVDVFAPLLAQSGNAYISTCVEAHTPLMSKQFGIDFAQLWHADPSVRELRKFALSDDYPFDSDEMLRRKFVRLHLAFFYSEAEDRTLEVNERAAVELYPRIDEWRAVAGDHWAPGRAMAAHLKERGLRAPEWPPKDET
jgi:hypothetical protein